MAARVIDKILVILFNFYSKGVKDIAVTLNEEHAVDEDQPTSI